MKRILITLAICFMLFQMSILAQENNFLLYGNIKNSYNDTLVLKNHYGRYMAVTDKNGQFRYDLRIESPDFLNFQTDGIQFTIFLIAGDTMEMSFDKNSFDQTITFKGDQAILNKELLSISKGQPAPNFSLKDSKGDLVNLNDFKGKYVYIDVWNSGCKPCFKEFKRMEELIDKYSDKNIVFIGVSLDSSESIWKKTIERKELKGIQLFGNGWKSDFVKNYSIIFNPRFILIDKDQKIIYLSAPRPSGEIDDVLSKLDGL